MERVLIKVNHMGLDDGIKSYIGREAEWAAECAFEGMDYANNRDGTIFKPSDAPRLIDEVWHFVTETCDIEEVSPPSKADAVKELILLINSRFDN